MSHHAVALKRPLLRLLDGLVYSGPALAYIYSLLSIVSGLNGQPDEMDVGDSAVPGWGERLDQLAFDCRMSLNYLQGHSNLFCTGQRFSIGLISCDWMGKVSVLVFWHFQLVTSLAR